MTTRNGPNPKPRRVMVYDFDTIPRKGIGARLHDMLNCLVYCCAHDADMCLIENQAIPYYVDNWARVFDWADTRSAPSGTASALAISSLTATTTEDANDDADQMVEPDEPFEEASGESSKSARRRKKKRNKAKKASAMVSTTDPHDDQAMPSQPNQAVTIIPFSETLASSTLSSTEADSTAVVAKQNEMDLPMDLPVLDVPFDGFRILTRQQVKSKRYPVWNNLAFGGWGREAAPDDNKRKCFSLAFYATCMQRLFRFKPHAMAKIEQLVQQSGFKDGDIVVHFRLTDKIQPAQDLSTLPESAEQDPKWYWQEVANYLATLTASPSTTQATQANPSTPVATTGKSGEPANSTPSTSDTANPSPETVSAASITQGVKQPGSKKKKKRMAMGNNSAESAPQDMVERSSTQSSKASQISQDIRIFLCSDSDEAFQHLPKIDIPILWDESETRIQGGFCPNAYRDRLNQASQEEEFWTAMKNWTLMARSSLLVGGRCSYFFRIAELLHWPKPCANVKDSDTFGIAEYAAPNATLVRPCRLRCYCNFLNKRLQPSEFERCKRQMAEQGLTTVHQVLSPKLAEQLDLWFRNDMPRSWLMQSIMHHHNQDGYAPNTSRNFDLNQKASIDRHVKMAIEDHSYGAFTYSFKRTIQEHENGCTCPICRLNDSLLSFEFLDFVSELVGERVTQTIETFVSCYEKGDWLAMHSDKVKDFRRYAFVFSFNRGWRVQDGGLLHFIRPSTKYVRPGEPAIPEVYHTVPPLFNVLNIFRVIGGEKDHLVSEVTNPAVSRFSFSGWVA